MIRPLSRCTTWRIGGPADFLVRTTNAEDIIAAVRWASDQGLPVTIIGGGSNLLVGGRRHPRPGDRFEGVRRTVGGSGAVGGSWRRDSIAEVGAQAPLSWVGRFASEHGWSGMDWGVGLPGTIGGATVNNAGAHGTEQKDHLESITLLKPRWRAHWNVDREWLNPTYRNTTIKAMARPRDVVVLDVTMRLPQGDVTNWCVWRMSTLLIARRPSLPAPARVRRLPTPTVTSPAGCWRRLGSRAMRSARCRFRPSTRISSSMPVAALRHKVRELIDYGRSIVLEQFGVTLETRDRVYWATIARGAV